MPELSSAAFAILGGCINIACALMKQLQKLTDIPRDAQELEERARDIATVLKVLQNHKCEVFLSAKDSVQGLAGLESKLTECMDVIRKISARNKFVKFIKAGRDRDRLRNLGVHLSAKLQVLRLALEASRLVADEGFQKGTSQELEEVEVRLRNLRLDELGKMDETTATLRTEFEETQLARKRAVDSFREAVANHDGSDDDGSAPDAKDVVAALEQELAELRELKDEQEKNFLEMIATFLAQPQQDAAADGSHDQQQHGMAETLRSYFSELETCFSCPISYSVMDDPCVLVETGQTYEWKAIVKHLRTRNTDPMTGELRERPRLTRNWVLKNAIDVWRKHRTTLFGPDGDDEAADAGGGERLQPYREPRYAGEADASMAGPHRPTNPLRQGSAFESASSCAATASTSSSPSARESKLADATSAPWLQSKQASSSSSSSAELSSRLQLSVEGSPKAEPYHDTVTAMRASSLRDSVERKPPKQQVAARLKSGSTLDPGASKATSNEAFQRNEALARASSLVSPRTPDQGVATTGPPGRKISLLPMASGCSSDESLTSPATSRGSSSNCSTPHRDLKRGKPPPPASSQALPVAPAAAGAVLRAPSGRQPAARPGWSLATCSTLGAVILWDSEAGSSSSSSSSRPPTILHEGEGRSKQNLLNMSIASHGSYAALTAASANMVEESDDSAACVAWSHDGSRLAAGAEFGRSLMLWSALSSRSAATPPAAGPLYLRMRDSYAATCLAWHPGSDQLAAGCKDGQIRVWDIGAGGATTLAALDPRPQQSRARGYLAAGNANAAVTDVSWRPWVAAPRYLASCDADGCISLWDVDQELCEAQWEHTRPGPIARMSSGTASPTGPADTRARSMTSCCWSPDGRQLASGRGGTVRIWDIVTSKHANSWRTGFPCIISTDWQPTTDNDDDNDNESSGGGGGAREAGLLAACFGGETVVHLWDSRTAGQAQIRFGHQNFARVARWRPDGAQLATADVEGHLYLWDPRNPGGPMCIFHDQGTGSITAISWRPQR